MPDQVHHEPAAWLDWLNALPLNGCPHVEAAQLIASVEPDHQARAVECLLLLGARWAWHSASASTSGSVDLEQLVSALATTSSEYGAIKHPYFKSSSMLSAQVRYDASELGRRSRVKRQACFGSQQGNSHSAALAQRQH